MRLEFLFLGKTKNKYCAALVEEYHKRIRHQVQAEIIIIKEKKNSSRQPERIMEQEGEQLLRQIPDHAFLVALDVKGRELSSEKLAGQLSQWEGRAVKSVSFIVGGPYGLTKAVLDRADLILSLSRMTFPHDLARVMLLEQIYRAYGIKAGSGYHK